MPIMPLKVGDRVVSSKGVEGYVEHAGPYGDQPFQVKMKDGTYACFINEDGTSAHNDVVWTPERKVRVHFDKRQKQPQYPGDPNRPTWLQTFSAPWGVAQYKVANALEKLGFHVFHPVTHPNGRGGIRACVFHPLPKPLPKFIEIE
jgi:hypothetical protein